MSGVFGCFCSAPNALIVPQVKRMADAMCHEARQVVRLTSVGRAGAFGQLSIGIFNRAPQPRQAADGAVQLYLCGEFYHQEQRRAALAAAGALELAADDAELALQVYLRDGADGLTTLEGAFVVAVWDELTDTLWLVNDRFGLYPHYVAHTAGTFIFAPELKGVLSASNGAHPLDMTAVAQYVRFQQLLGERTWVEDVELLAPATLVRYTPANDRLVTRRYWDWDAIKPNPRITFDEAVDECVRLFQRAITAMTQPPHRVGVYLSGGMDGRTILGFIDPKVPVSTVTFGAPNCRDAMYAKQLAQRANRDNRLFPFHDGAWVLEHNAKHLRLTEGMHGWMHGHGMSTLEDARTLMDVNLSGWDGGTTLGGHLDSHETDHRYRHAANEADLTKQLYEGFCRVFTWPGLTDAEAATLFAGPEKASLNARARESFEEELKRTAHYAAPYRADFFYILQHVRRSTQNMVVFARSALEVRCPFFDYDLISFLYSLPEHILATSRFHHAVLTRRAPQLALVPHEKTNQLPHSNQLIATSYKILQKAKRGIHRTIAPIFPPSPRLYADYENYLRHELRPWAEDILFDQQTSERGLFDETVVRELWERHVRGDELWTIGKIAPLITIEQVIRALHEEHSFAQHTSTY